MTRRRLLLLGTAAGSAVGAVALARRLRRVPAVVDDRPRLAPGVDLIDVSFDSPALGRAMSYRVLMPTGAKQPLVPIYLLHGGGGSFRDWSNHSDVARLVGKLFMLVSPQGDYSYFTNAALRPADRYETYLMEDVINDVDQRFRTRWRERYMLGVSMGGFGAIKLALRWPRYFRFVGALSPAIDVTHRVFSYRRLGQSRALQGIFGGPASATRRENDPFRLARTLPIAHLPFLPFFHLTCGVDESLLAPNREFAAVLAERHIPHRFDEVPGGHDWNQWNAQLPRIFDSLIEHLEPY
jgi:putative tributyrin esterase